MSALLDEYPQNLHFLEKKEAPRPYYYRLKTTAIAPY